jgi:hypothetical protein
MHLITHFLISWNVADFYEKVEKRDLFLISVCGISPDIDGIGAVVEMFTKDTSHPLLWFSEYHHKLHTLLFSLIISTAFLFFSKRKVFVFLFSLLVFQIHIFCDIVGARGPDGYQWPIPYLFPFSDKIQLQWNGQWALNGWQNILITVVLVIATLKTAILRGYSPVELFSQKSDRTLVETLRKRFKT